MSALDLAARFPEYFEDIEDRTNVLAWGPDLKKVLDAYSLVERDIEQVVSAARDVFFQNGVLRTAGSLHLVPDTSIGRPSVVIRMSLVADPDFAGRLESLIYDHLVDADLPAIETGMLTILVSCATVITHADAA